MNYLIPVTDFTSIRMEGQSVVCCTLETNTNVSGSVFKIAYRGTWLEYLLLKAWFVYRHTNMHTHTRMYTQTHTHAHTDKHKHKQTNTHAHTHKHAHIQNHKQTYTRTHIHTLICYPLPAHLSLLVLI